MGLLGLKKTSELKNTLNEISSRLDNLQGKKMTKYKDTALLTAMKHRRKY